MEQQKHPVRRNRSFLASAEQVVIHWLLPRIPAHVRSLDLTIFGMLGSLFAAVGLIGCNSSYQFLPLVLLGIGMNWFGDSLDGSLARFRQEERPRFGFLVDHTCDLFSQILVIVAFGFSPFLSVMSAFVILLCYLLFSAYTYIRAAAHHVHQMSYIGVGATEFRILMVVWAYFGAAANLNEPSFGPLTTLDVVILTLSVFAVVGLAVKAICDARTVALEEQEALAERNAAVSALAQPDGA